MRIVHGQMDDARAQQEIGGRLRELRGPLGGGQYKIKQHTVAEYVGVSTRAVQQWEDGTYKPTWANLHKLAEFFDVEARYILYGGEPTAQERLEVKVDMILSWIRSDLSPGELLEEIAERIEALHPAPDPDPPEPSPRHQE